MMSECDGPATLSYFFGCASCHVGVAVDPVLGDEDWFLEEARKQDVQIKESN